MSDIADLRQNYRAGTLDESEAAADPFDQFGRWFADARSVVREPNAMTIATADADGTPSARIVLLKGFDDRGFVFYSVHASQKGTDLAANPKAALVFYWPEIERQVRISGTVSRLTTEESDAYFQSRPRGSQLGAWVSRQSEVISDRAILDQRYRDLETAYEGRTIPLPPFWGGYRVSGDRFEFWQGRPNRLHDRLRYQRTDGHWSLERLAP